MLIASSTLQGLLTWPEMQNSLVPVLFGGRSRREPVGAAAQDGRRDGDRLDVVDRRRAAVEADVGRERRLQARLALLAFEAFEQRGLLAADVGAGAVDARRGRSPSRAARVLADQPGVIGLVDRRLQRSRSRMNSPRT
jgi:hypothetical protein